MTKRIQFFLAIPVLLAVGFASFSQKPKVNDMKRRHKVIMQVTQGDSLTQLAVIGQIRNIKQQLPDARIEVVCHANSLDMLLKARSKVASHIAELAQEDVQFVACENTMARRNSAVKDLISSVSTVPSGLVEIILKQEEGWSYVKGGH